MKLFDFKGPEGTVILVPADSIESMAVRGVLEGEARYVRCVLTCGGVLDKEFETQLETQAFVEGWLIARRILTTIRWPSGPEEDEPDWIDKLLEDIGPDMPEGADQSPGAELGEGMVVSPEKESSPARTAPKMRLVPQLPTGYPGRHQGPDPD